MLPLRRHACPTIAALRRTSERFLRYYHYDKPHRKLTHKEHATRFPGVLRDALWTTITQMPDTFCLDEHIDARGHLQLPIARGKVSFIRKVDTKGYIEVNGASYFIRRKYEGQYVTATLFTHKTASFEFRVGIERYLWPQPGAGQGRATPGEANP